jgi:hypothetical protein
MKTNIKINQVLIKLAKEENEETADTSTQEIDLKKMVAHFKWKMKINSNINN